MTRPNYTTPAGIREPRRLTWLPVAALAVGIVLLGVIVVSECRAAADHDRSLATHLLWSCQDNACRSHGKAMGQTACLLDAASLANTLPSGSKVACHRVKR